MSDLVVARNCSMNRSARGATSVKRIERSNGLDTVLYKNYRYIFLQTKIKMIFHLTYEQCFDLETSTS